MSKQWHGLDSKKRFQKNIYTAAAELSKSSIFTRMRFIYQNALHHE